MRNKSFEIKTIKEAEEGSFHFEGYASTYDNEDRDGDKMLKGCFDTSVKGKSVIPMLFNHDRNSVIGKLEIEADEKGLLAKGFFNLADSLAVNVYELMKMGALNSMSIGFLVKDYDPLDKDRPFGGWAIKEAEVVETSIVTVPSNTQAVVDVVKSFDAKESAAFKEIIKEAMRELQTEEKAKEARRQSILKTLDKGENTK